MKFELVIRNGEEKFLNALTTKVGQLEADHTIKDIKYTHTVLDDNDIFSALIMYD